MNTRLILFTCIAGLTLFFSGCSKNDDDHQGIIPLPPVENAFPMPRTLFLRSKVTIMW